MVRNVKNELGKYEELKDLYIKHIGTNKRLEKVLDKKPKDFMKYMQRKFIIKERFQVMVYGLVDGSEFMVAKDTEEQAKETKAKFDNCEDVNVKIKLVRYLFERN